MQLTCSVFSGAWVFEKDRSAMMPGGVIAESQLFQKPILFSVLPSAS
jgi:hypothetical protein